MKKPKAWVLDLDADTRDVVTNVLEQEGFVVLPFEFTSDLIGLRAAEPTVAVIDAWTARYSPRQTCAALAHGGVILMTTSEEQERVWASLGVNQVLRKPFAADALRAAVRVMTKRR